ncbi:MAG: hypothetical protein AB1349_09410 [Elusimicrobiota bacterium]
MKPTRHIAISLSISVVWYLIFNSLKLSLALLLAGVLIDIDHLVEYFREVGFKTDIKRFFYCCENYAFKKNILILHSWELFVVFSLVVFFMYPDLIIYGIYIGYSVHLVFDQLSNLSKPLTYSLIYRWKNDFQTEKIWQVELLGSR